MAKEINDIRNFNMRVSKDMWVFLKHDAMNRETTMTSIITGCLDKYKKAVEKKLTALDTNV